MLYFRGAQLSKLIQRLGRATCPREPLALIRAFSTVSGTRQARTRGLKQSALVGVGGVILQA
jgi:hypothetical protein